MVTICPTCLNNQSLFILYFVFRMILTLNCDYFLKQRKPVDLRNGEELFSLRYGPNS
jgi:hypothetical protein